MSQAFDFTVRPRASLVMVEASGRMAFDDLRGEAAALENSAACVREFDITIHPTHGTLRGPRVQRHTCGKLLQTRHEGAMREWCQQLIGVELYPTRCAYLFFDEHSTLGLHQDVPSCIYTAVVHLAGLPPVLRILLDHPKVLSNEALLLACKASMGHPDLGIPIGLHADQPLLFRGQAYPHRLERFEGSCVLAAFCYAPLMIPEED